MLDSRMKAILSVIITLFLFAIGSQEMNAQKINSADIIGEWYANDKRAIFQIYRKSDGQYYGKIIWFIDEKDENGSLVMDKKNSDKKLRTRTIKGMGFIYNNGIYEDGTIYNSEDGNTYDAVLKLTDINTLEVRGYLLFEWLGKTVVWTRRK